VGLRVGREMGQREGLTVGRRERDWGGEEQLAVVVEAGSAGWREGLEGRRQGLLMSKRWDVCWDAGTARESVHGTVRPNYM
jgi:hypothetical protein